MSVNTPTLVLNRNWQAVNVIQASRAILHLWKANAMAVCPQTYETYGWDDWEKQHPTPGEKTIRSSQRGYRIPCIIVLMHYDRLPSSAIVFSHRNVHKRDKYICQYCSVQNPPEITVDHIVPKAQGGQSSWTNCVSACYDCNATKANRTPEEAGMKLRKQPQKPTWSPVFSFTSDKPRDEWRHFIK